jgi:hypothetical protein
VPKRHLSGRNAEQLAKSVTVGGEEIPVSKDAGTFIYITPDGINWPKKPTVGLPLDLAWLQVGDLVRLCDLRPGFSMGHLSHVRLVEVLVDILIHPGKWGQVRRNVLAIAAESEEEYQAAVAERLANVR